MSTHPNVIDNIIMPWRFRISYDKIPAAELFFALSPADRARWYSTAFTLSDVHVPVGDLHVVRVDAVKTEVRQRLDDCDLSSLIRGFILQFVLSLSEDGHDLERWSVRVALLLRVTHKDRRELEQARVRISAFAEEKGSLQFSPVGTRRKDIVAWVTNAFRWAEVATQGGSHQSDADEEIETFARATDPLAFLFPSQSVLPNGPDQQPTYSEPHLLHNAHTARH